MHLRFHDFKTDNTMLMPESNEFDEVSDEIRIVSSRSTNHGLKGRRSLRTAFTRVVLGNVLEFNSEYWEQSGS
jgi:hypothetical protein